MVKKSSHMFVTSLNMVKTVTHEDVTSEELGGAVTRATSPNLSAHFDSWRPRSTPIPKRNTEISPCDGRSLAP
ncbi:MAG: hypothetical protein NTZ35_03200 [Ignavibacteriales bacterium]|nr:hypothetical protein [Ignavibacteriales bacterium]